MSWTVSRQPHFKQQPKDQLVCWLYALFVDKPRDYVKKPMQECTGEEITQEWLYHLGVPVEDIGELAATGARTVPVMMPCITAFFMPRQAGDRPDIVPAGAVNFAFIGQFAETKQRDCIFTTEQYAGWFVASIRVGSEVDLDRRPLLRAAVGQQSGRFVADGPVAFATKRCNAGTVYDSEVPASILDESQILQPDRGFGNGLPPYP